VQTRREFLQRLAAAATALALDPLNGIVIEDDIYKNARIGLTVRRPPRWEYSSIADFAALRERQVLQNLLEGEPHPLKDPHNLPVFLFEHPGFRKGEFAPAISLWDEPLEGPMPEDQPLAHQVMLLGFALAYRDLRLDGSPRTIDLKGTSATLSRWSYSHDLDTGDSYPLSMRSIVVFRESRVHTYHLVDSLPAPCIKKRVWDDFIGSIAYAV
jgi:hypothetical protein